METIALRNDKKGFTLIELVIVIILIGILSATALPKFANLTTQARDAANQGLAGGLGAAVSIAHAAWIAAGSSSTASTVTLDGTTVNVNGNGWPDGGAGSTTTITAAQCLTMVNSVLNNPPTVQTAAPPCATATPNCYSLSTTTGANCIFVYGPASAITITYNIGTGAVTSTSQ